MARFPVSVSRTTHDSVSSYVFFTVALLTIYQCLMLEISKSARADGGRFFRSMCFMGPVIREHALPPFRCLGWEQNDGVIDDQCVNKMGLRIYCRSFLWRPESGQA